MVVLLDESVFGGWIRGHGRVSDADLHAVQGLGPTEHSDRAQLDEPGLRGDHHSGKM